MGKDGGPAFPQGMGEHVDGVHFAEDGMSLRDYFAAKALTGLLTLCREDDHSGVTYIEYCSRLAYETADAMLAARAEVKP